MDFLKQLCLIAMESLLAPYDKSSSDWHRFSYTSVPPIIHKRTDKLSVSINALKLILGALFIPALIISLNGSLMLNSGITLPTTPL
uniref:Uncharacterized protein n=1 Tax=Arundo donax TaxID=35708 RepID=A0A0A9H3M2_ARUDO